MLSLLTLVRGRRPQLANLMKSVACQEQRPNEIVIAAMDDDPIEIPDELRDITRIVPAPRLDVLPLAHARNAAAREARGDRLIFFDVDCIASPGLVASYDAALAAADGCFMGEVRYLPIIPEPAEALDFDALHAASERHVSKPVPPEEGFVEEPNHGELWGLNFGISRDAFRRAGGFDERFVGYAGEETDFAWSLRDNGVPLYRLAKACAYHQYHPINIPPLHHFDTILANAEYFHRKRGRWCMDYWLGQFADAGLIGWNADADGIERLRQPTAAEIAASRAPDGTLYS